MLSSCVASRPIESLSRDPAAEPGSAGLPTWVAANSPASPRPATRSTHPLRTEAAAARSRSAVATACDRDVYG